MSGVHVRGVLLRSNTEKTATAVQVTVWPLPDVPELHTAIYAACRDAVNAELAKRGLTTGTMSDLTALGPMQ